ncbi:histidine kinase [Caldovatus sediminis]|uniref:histidine kinase n=1 Tax=Caldovatus sediminis TaxID=2041189 RepID=A0A8J2Z7B5_9PROT|nr:ATP-binding protein [Caldovatus sediminis]GGG17051.1 histidine kinase [Caldovatus sediminis]
MGDRATAPPLPPAGRWLCAALLVGGVPSAALLLLLAGGWLAPGPGLLALAATLLAAALLAWLWLRDLLRLAAALRQAAAARESTAATGAPPPSALEIAAPLVPAVSEVAEGAARLARRLEERCARLEAMRRADAAILEALPDPLLVLGAGRLVPLRANAAARALFGIPSAGPAAGDAAALLRHPALAEAVDRAAATGQAQAADLTLAVPVARELAATVIPLDPPLADGGRLLVVLADRTRERAVERMRADFVANASHELRTPLASLIGFIETLRGPARDDPEARARFLGIMAEQAERMRRLIDDLLGLTRIELTEHTPPSGRVDLAALARAEAEAMAPILAARRVTLALDLAPEGAAVAEPADAEQLAQVVRNLLDNAVRHGREGGTVRLAVAPAGPGMAQRLPAARPGVLLSVTDDGPGIPREHIPRLTERFYRVDRGRSRAAGGTGLGLAIVKHIVNRHRGQLLIESEEGQGATFRVWLPAPAAGAGTEGAPARR